MSGDRGTGDQGTRDRGTADRHPSQRRPAGTARMRMDRIVLAGDLAGTMVFAAEGAMAAIGRGLDVFGVVVVACVVALGG
ncbi:TRIC cation channel family protein, partial [Nguyenibacter vanlangensis]